MNIPHKQLSVDINRKNQFTVDFIGHVNDKDVRYIDVTFNAGGTPITLEKGCTATVTYVSEGVLIDQAAECVVTGSTVVIGVDSEKVENLRSGILEVQPKVIDPNGRVLTMQIPILVRISPDIAEHGQVDDDSLGSYAEVVREIAAARGDYPDLKDRLDHTGAPTDEQVAEALEDYFDEHPTVESVLNKKSEIPGQSQEGDSDTNYPTVGAVRDFVDVKTSDLEDYIDDELDILNAKISSVYKFKGSVATYQDLPSTNLTVGDVYNVESDGSNYAWTGSVWDNLGADVDLSNYQTKIDASHKLSSDLVDDTNKSNKFVTSSEKTAWGNKYDKPSGGIPKTDLSSAVQTSLGKADSALQSHQDISGKENTSNKVTSISSSSTDAQYPSAKCVYDNTFSKLPVDFEMHVGIINATNFSLYGVSSLGNYHASIPVSPGERYIINCRSINSSYPGAFYTLNGTKVSSIFEDSGVTHLNVEIAVPAGVDTLWLNNNRNHITLDQWKVYKILPSGNYTEVNNNKLRALETEKMDKSVEAIRRLKNLESLFTFHWRPFDKAYYCFVNDGSKNWVNVFYDVFHSHNLPFCAATVGENIELQYDPTNNGPTVKETLDLIVADGGEVMVYLNAENLSANDTFESWYNKAVRDGKRMIEAYGYQPRGLILSMNSARNSAVGQKICEQFFDYADRIGKVGSQYDIRRQQFSDTSTVADVKAYIDSTVNTPGFYPIMLHGTYMEPWASAEGMEEILSYIENNYSSNAAVSTYSYVFDTFGTNGFLTLSDLPIYNGGVQ